MNNQWQKENVNKQVLGRPCSIAANNISQKDDPQTWPGLIWYYELQSKSSYSIRFQYDLKSESELQFYDLESESDNASKKMTLKRGQVFLHHLWFE